LKALGPVAAAALSTLIALLARETSDQPGEDRHVLLRVVAESLEKVGEGRDEQVVPALVELLKSRDPDKRFLAASTLSQHNPPPRSAVSALIAAMKDTMPGVRFTSAQALGRFDGPEGAAALQALLAGLADNHIWVRAHAARSLAHHGEAGRAAIPEVVHLLRSSNPSVRYAAAQTLGDFGPSASEAIPALLEALPDETSFVRESVEKALAEIIPVASATTDEALAALSQGDAARRRGAVCDLVRARSGGSAGADAATVVRALRGALGDPDLTVRETAAAALTRMEPAERRH
jgi:HEAT repeat protein